MKQNWGIFMISLMMLTIINGSSEAKPEININGEKNIGGCSDRLNCVSSQSSNGRHAVKPFRLKGTPAKSWNNIANFVANMPRTTIVDASDQYLHAECKSRLLGFIDDLELQLDPSTGLIAIRSASRVGHYDFGVNRRRVEKLRNTLQEKGLIY
jgi:uncharacterized protein (DUF1499 family)